MGENPTAIRDEIAQTRERLGDTVDALGYKADVPARAKDSLNDRVDTLKSKITGVGSSISDGVPDSGEVKERTRQAVGVAQENPLGLAIGAAAVGFLAGMLIPTTRVEDEQIGPVADQVRQQLRETGQEALEHGKQIAQDTVQIAGEKVQEAAAEVGSAARENVQEHGEDLADSARQSAEQVKDAAQRAS